MNNNSNHHNNNNIDGVNIMTIAVFKHQTCSTISLFVVKVNHQKLHKTRQGRGIYRAKC